MEITERLRNTPTGLIVFVGDMKIIVEKYRPYYNGQNKIPCRGCVFRDEGARFSRVLICLHGPSEARSRKRGVR